MQWKRCYLLTDLNCKRKKCKSLPIFRAWGFESKQSSHVSGVTWVTDRKVWGKENDSCAWAFFQGNAISCNLIKKNNLFFPGLSFHYTVILNLIDRKQVRIPWLDSPLMNSIWSCPVYLYFKVTLRTFIASIDYYFFLLWPKKLREIWGEIQA